MSYSKAFIGNNVGDFTYAAKKAPITGVTLHLDGETDVFVGSEGNVLEVNLPICNSTTEAEQYGQYILDSLSNYCYQPYEANGAMFNPAVQVGDGVTVRSVYGGIYTRDTDFSKLMKAKISAPNTEEVDTEYPFTNSYVRKENRKYKRLESHMESEFAIQAGEISAKVSQLSPSGQTSFSWSLTSAGHYWYNNGSEVMSVTSEGLTVKGRISALSGYIGNESNGFVIGSTSISNGKTSLSDSNAGVYIGTDGISLGNSNASGGTDTFFKVDSNGNAIVKNLTVRGRIYYQETASSTANYKTASASFTGIGGGVQFNNSQNISSSETEIFMANTSIVGKGGGTVGSQAGSSVVIKGYGVSWTPITINGTTYNVMTH